MFEENDPGNITPGLYADAELPKPAEPIAPVEGLVSPAEGAFHDNLAMKANPESPVEMAWPTNHQEVQEIAPDYKMVEGNPDAPVVSPDLIGDVQSPTETVKPAEEPEPHIQYHSMDPAMDAGTNFTLEVPTLEPAKPEPSLPSGEDIWAGKTAEKSDDIAA